MKKTLWAGAVGLTAIGLLAGGPGRANATMDMQKKAKAAGIAVANCQHCHVDKLPKKGMLWLDPVLVAEVEYRRWPQGGLMQQGAFKGLRSDKKAREVVREVPINESRV